jgi:hypothetical protein
VKAEARPATQAPASRPAFYALRPGGWRDLVTILHPPYTLWHLSYVAIGAAAAPEVHVVRLVATLAAFFFAVGVGAHALDELQGRPLGTALSDRALALLAVGGLGIALGIGVAGVFVVSASLIPFVVAGVFLALAYNLELFGARFHSDFWFAASWGAFPALTSWWCNALGIGDFGDAMAGAAAALGCFWLTVAQRRLSSPVRELRRRTESVEGRQILDDGEVRALDAAALAAPLDGALRAISLGLPLLAAGLLAIRL